MYFIQINPNETHIIATIGLLYTGKAIQLQAWTGREVSRWLRLPDSNTISK